MVYIDTQRFRLGVWADRRHRSLRESCADAATGGVGGEILGGLSNRLKHISQATANPDLTRIAKPS